MSNENTLWMGDLELYMTEKFIFQAFEQMGETVMKVKLINPRQSRGPAGYCFVEFSSEEAAQRAMLRLNGKVIPGSAPPKRFKLNRACFGKEHLAVPEYSLFVGDISEEIDDYNLFTIFSSKYKSCKGAKVVIDANGRSRGYGFVRFTDESEQQNALTEMQGYTGINIKPLRVSLATPKRSGTGSSQSGESVMPNSYYQQQYYPNYQPFYNTTNSWWSAYQPPADYYYGSYGDGSAYGYDENAYAGGQAEEAVEQSDDEALVDPAIEVDVKQYNKEFIAKSEELYKSLEESRWHPIDSSLSLKAKGN